MHFDNLEIKTRLILGPMAGVTDIAFRQICREMGCGLTCTEMISSKALCYQDKKTRALMELAPGESPAAIQLFGSEPECMAKAAEKVMELQSPAIIDINMGCPVGKIVKSGDGSALMLDPPKASAVIRAVRSAVNVPVTVKFRKGFDSGKVNALDFAKMCEDSGAAAVAVHGRTRAQMYAGKADWNIIKAVKQAVNIPVIANGDVFSGADAAHILKYTGADAVMIGRGAMGNPWIFQEALAVINCQEIPSPPTFSEKVDTAVRQFELAAASRGERAACLEARRHFAWYLRGMPYASFFKEKIMSVSTLNDIYNVSLDIKDSLRDIERRGNF